MEGFLGLTLPNFIGQLINFIILLTLLIFFGYKPIRRILNERAERIRKGIEQAEATKREYENSRIEVDKRVSKARDEGQMIVGQAEKAGERIKEEARQAARMETQAIVEKARLEIERERDSIIDELRAEFVDTAILAAEKVISNVLDKEKHRILIEETLTESAALSKRN